jgi:hypothetical protein
MHAHSLLSAAAYRALPLLLLISSLNHSLAAPTNLYSTQFESTEGYNTNSDLAGQNGWTNIGSGGNGLTSIFPGQGQQAYVGYSAPTNLVDDTLSLWQPINFSPIASGLARVTFSTLVNIEDSTNSYFDSFQWSVYNIDSNRLFTIDFDNTAISVRYALDGTNASYVDTGVLFENSTTYTLTVVMDFASNSWSATLNSDLLATNKPMTTNGLSLTLGDVRAIWLLSDTNSPGDNRMLFDNYTITAEEITPPSPRVTLVGRNGSGQAQVRLNGLNGSRFAIEASTNLVNWMAVTTNLVTTNSFDYLDTNAPAPARRVYRGRWVP